MINCACLWYRFLRFIQLQKAFSVCSTLYSNTFYFNVDTMDPSIHIATNGAAVLLLAVRWWVSRFLSGLDPAVSNIVRYGDSIRVCMYVCV